MAIILWLLAATALVPGKARAQAQKQFLGDPLPYTIGAFIYNQFMQLDNISPQRLHTGIDIETTYPGADQRVVAPIRYGSDSQVFQIGPDWVRLLARDRQNGNVAVFEALHIIPEPSLSLWSWIVRNTPLGTVDPSQPTPHLHAALFLAAGASQCCSDVDLVHPQRNGFSTVGSWNDDTYAPKVDLTVVHGAAVGNPTIFEIHAYDQADLQPSVYSGIYAIRLYVDDVLVDALSFDRWRNKSGSSSPTASEYYYCTAPQCTPSGTNNPSVLQYKLSWGTQAGDHIWRLDVFDAKGNLLHGDPRNGLPGREMPAVSMGGTILDGRVHLTWRIDAGDLREAGVQAFSVWESPDPVGVYRKVNTAPIPAAEGQELYDFFGDAPAGVDSVWYRLTAQNTVGSTLMLGEARLGVPAIVDGLRGYPNPIADRYTIALSLAHRSTGEVTIFDLSGRRVRAVHNGPLEPGVTRVVWDGRDDEGRSVPNGVYLLKVRTLPGPEFGSRKIAVFR